MNSSRPNKPAFVALLVERVDIGAEGIERAAADDGLAAAWRTK